ncbi:MAG: hypothetical protein JOS17DRAFT_445909 [Linnemannia elongata]|nr:MAG: hypothetical protein JOS17DRAFT_445909 [Linnemannia elongata]
MSDRIFSYPTLPSSLSFATPSFFTRYALTFSYSLLYHIYLSISPPISLFLHHLASIHCSSIFNPLYFSKKFFHTFETTNAIFFLMLIDTDALVPLLFSSDYKAFERT